MPTKLFGSVGSNVLSWKRERCRAVGCRQPSPFAALETGDGKRI